ncbi:MAG: hypothetical protein GKR94_05400 [Gammaproteobacteria bacterium]|nr:hypothetical protein [Gammaproteobacteria bacterium]
MSGRYDLATLSGESRLAILDGLQAIGIEARLEDTELLVVPVSATQASEAEGLIAAMRKTHRLVARKVLRERRSKAHLGCSDRELADCKDLHFFGDGLTGISGDLLRLFRYFEDWFRGLARDFGAHDQHYPVMLPSELLHEVGYFGNFPQHVTLCCHFPDRLPVLENIAHQAKNVSSESLRATFGETVDAPSHVLTPAVCLPCYSQHQGLRISRGSVHCITMQNHVFRYEANRFRPLSRGWDFSVRDIVLFGSGNDLLALRAEVMERVFELCESLDLDVSLELANDPFFLDTGRDKVVYQRMGEVKYELLFHCPGRDAPLAASSFNLHRDYYSSIYDIAFDDGSRAETACMGFGIERWLYGFVTQKGLDTERWPEPVRHAVTQMRDR